MTTGPAVPSTASSRPSTTSVNCVHRYLLDQRPIDLTVRTYREHVTGSRSRQGRPSRGGRRFPFGHRDLGAVRVGQK